MFRLLPFLARRKKRYALHPTGTLKCTCNHAELDHDAFGCEVPWCACCAMTPVELWERE